MNKTLKRILYYILGMVIISYGVAFMIKAAYGLSSIDAASLGLKHLLAEVIETITIGEATIIVNILLVLISEAIKPSLSRLLAIPVSIVFGKALDGALWTINWFEFNDITGPIFFCLGGLMTPFGSAFVVTADFPPLAGDTVVASLLYRFKGNASKAKTTAEILFFSMAVLFCALADIFTEFKFTDGLNMYSFFLFGIASLFFPKFLSKVQGGYEYVQLLY
ncbi:MAG TPA: hypothetical protein GXZ51_01055 [Acholeplasma sp.]|jgi:uncharacterized membrane protein YczE|nr:hypothetical protein [Acholeplasma sp.]